MVRHWHRLPGEVVDNPTGHELEQHDVPDRALSKRLD